MTEDEIKALKAKRQARLERAIQPQGSGYARRHITPPAQAKPPDWNYYQHKPKVEPWEACALALNIEPDSVDYRPESWDEHETWRGFPSDEIGDHFIKLLRLLNSNQFESQYFTENFAMGVRLSEFAAWCAPVVRDLIGSDIPKELAAMAKDAPQAAPAAKGEAKTASTTKKKLAQTWWRKDYEIMTMAQSAGDSLRRKNKRTSNRAIGDAVALEIEQREKCGKKRKGPDGLTIKNADLLGWKYEAE